MIYIKAEDFDIIGFYSYSVTIPESCKIFKVHQKDAEDKQSFKRMAKLIKDCNVELHNYLGKVKCDLKIIMLLGNSDTKLLVKQFL